MASRLTSNGCTRSRSEVLRKRSWRNWPSSATPVLASSICDSFRFDASRECPTRSDRIRYRIPLVGLDAELRLTKRVGFETLLYQLEERLADHGKLIFNIAPTEDGNSRLSIYAAFDYKKGDGVAGRILWEGTRVLFPGFVHDIVWNYTLCTIKEQVERKGDHRLRRLVA